MGQRVRAVGLELGRHPPRTRAAVVQLASVIRRAHGRAVAKGREGRRREPGRIYGFARDVEAFPTPKLCRQQEGWMERARWMERMVKRAEGNQSILYPQLAAVQLAFHLITDQV